MLSFQELDVYRLATAFFTLANELPATLPKGHAHLVDQLRRAALSISLNIAEAAGRTSRADAARCYAIARESAMECGAIVDAMRALGLVTGEPYERAVGILTRIVGMLTKLCR